MALTFGLIISALAIVVGSVEYITINEGYAETIRWHRKLLQGVVRIHSRLWKSTQRTLVRFEIHDCKLTPPGFSNPLDSLTRISTDALEYMLVDRLSIRDSLKYHQGKSFHTKSKVNGCTRTWNRGGWQNNCYYSNLNGKYNQTGETGFVWSGFGGGLLKASMMMIRRRR